MRASYLVATSIEAVTSRPGKLVTSTLLRDQFERDERSSTQLNKNEMKWAMCTACSSERTCRIAMRAIELFFACIRSNGSCAHAAGDPQFYSVCSIVLLTRRFTILIDPKTSAMRYWRSIAQGSTSGCISTPDDVELLKAPKMKRLGLVPVNHM